MAYYKVEVNLPPQEFFYEVDNEAMALELARRQARQVVMDFITVSKPMCPCQAGKDCPEEFATCSECSKYYGAQ